MNDQNSNATMASEIIADKEKEIERLRNAIKSINTDMSKILAIFQSVHHSIETGFISKSEADAAMSAIQSMLCVLMDNVTDSLRISQNISINK